jgi:D-serine deaminase-like pyridoxal phosphate-dependent protein
VGEAVVDLDTPSILCDLDRLERDIADYHAHGPQPGPVPAPCQDLQDPRDRPHATGGRRPGIICAKPSEAEPFVAAGIDDVCIAYPVLGPQKWRRIAAMAARGVRPRGSGPDAQRRTTSYRPGWARCWMAAAASRNSGWPMAARKACGLV